MRTRISVPVVALWMAAMQAAFAASSVERIKNEKVVVTESTLAPGESQPISDKLPSMVV